VNSLGDGTDRRWRFNGQQNAATLQYINDNPRVENLWQYLKRCFNYRTGIVTTAAVTDAAPAVEGASRVTARRGSKLRASTAKTRCRMAAPPWT
jgi:alkaline phosphatase